MNTPESEERIPNSGPWTIRRAHERSMSAIVAVFRQTPKNCWGRTNIEAESVHPASLMLKKPPDELLDK